MRRLEDLPREELVENLRRALARIEELEALEAANGELVRVNAELTRVNAGLSERLAKIERLISRNSKNSSIPPSKDDDLGRKPPADSPTAGTGEPTKRGKRRGAPGFRMEWKPVPDRRKAHRPTGLCTCGRDLADALDLGVVARHQQTEIPEIRAEVVEHERHAVRCRCGRARTAPLPVAGAGRSARRSADR